jgi:hypothetical protein
VFKASNASAAKVTRKSCACQIDARGDVDDDDDDASVCARQMIDDNVDDNAAVFNLVK